MIQINKLSKLSILIFLLLINVYCSSQNKNFKQTLFTQEESGFLKLKIEDDNSMESKLQICANRIAEKEDLVLMESCEIEGEVGFEKKIKIPEGEYYLQVKFSSVNFIPLAYSDITERTILFGFEYENILLNKKIKKTNLTNCILSKNNILCPSLKIEKDKIKELKFQIGSESKFNLTQTVWLWAESLRFPIIPLIAGFFIFERDVEINGLEELEKN